MGDAELQNKIDELNASIETLDTSIGILNSNMVTLSERYIKPAESALSVQSQTEIIRLEYVSAHEKVFTNDDSEHFGGDTIAYDNNHNKFYATTEWPADFALVSFTEEGSEVTTIKLLGGTQYYYFAYDDSTDKLWGVTSVGVVESVVNINTSTGNEDEVLVVTDLHPGIMIAGLCHHPKTEDMIILYYDVSNNLRIGVLNLSTGAITGGTPITNDSGGAITDARGLMSARGLIWSSCDYDKAVSHLYGWIPYEWQNALVSTLKPANFLGNDIASAVGSYHTYETNTVSSLYLGSLTSVTRVSLHDSDITLPVSAAALPLPSGAATSALQTTMVTALQKIDDLQNALRSISTDVLITQIEEAGSIAGGNVAMSDAQAEIVAARADRKGLLIQNVDTTDTVWIGPTGVAVGTGIELLPKQSTVLNHYTGSTASIFGLCDTGKTANIRYLEAF